MGVSTAAAGGALVAVRLVAVLLLPPLVAVPLPPVRLVAVPLPPVQQALRLVGDLHRRLHRQRLLTLGAGHLQLVQRNRHLSDDVVPLNRRLLLTMSDAGPTLQLRVVEGIQLLRPTLRAVVPPVHQTPVALAHLGGRIIMVMLILTRTVTQ